MKKAIFGVTAVLLCASFGMSGCADDEGDNKGKFKVPEYKVGGECDRSVVTAFCDGNKLIECNGEIFEETDCGSGLCVWSDYSWLTEYEQDAFKDVAECEDRDELEKCDKPGTYGEYNCFELSPGDFWLESSACVTAHDGNSYLHHPGVPCKGACSSKTSCTLVSD